MIVQSKICDQIGSGMDLFHGKGTIFAFFEIQYVIMVQSENRKGTILFCTKFFVNSFFIRFPTISRNGAKKFFITLKQFAKKLKNGNFFILPGY